jgi:DNA-binding MarR family transcriptional regulator/GNAT superfamily N-acetyltransferase
MEKNVFISELRQFSRKLIRELGMLSLNQPQKAKNPAHWHALIEIAHSTDLSLSELSARLLLSLSASSRIVDVLIKQGFVRTLEIQDRRQKILMITPLGQNEIVKIDDFSNARIRGALDYLTSEKQAMILESIESYSLALEQSRYEREGVKIKTLPANKFVRAEVKQMIEDIQCHEFGLHIDESLNANVLSPQEDFHYNGGCNFWYAASLDGDVIGSIGVKRLNNTAGEIKKFFIYKEHRSKGISRKLFAKVAQSACKNGFSMLYLGTVSRLKAAHRFYEKIGFKSLPSQELPAEFKIGPLDDCFYGIETLKLVQSLAE